MGPVFKIRVSPYIRRIFASDNIKMIGKPETLARLFEGAAIFLSRARSEKDSMEIGDRKRVVITGVQPEIDCGRFPIKRVVGEKVEVTADIFSDGHDALAARLLFRRGGDREWRETPMQPIGNDRWAGQFRVEELGSYVYTLRAWIDPFKTWQEDFRKKTAAGQWAETDLRIGIDQVEAALERASPEDRERLARFSGGFVTEDRKELIGAALDPRLADLIGKYTTTDTSVRYEKELAVLVDRVRARFSSWYEVFPRSCSEERGRHGTFRDCEKILPEIAAMGFDVLYLPPIHPIGVSGRKGKNNTLQVGPENVGSPWAIGSDEGGHKTIHPELGTLDDFERLVKKARDYGMEIALDLAFQCSPDHPYVREHPAWFRWRPDGTVQFAENPPKKYEDIIPLNFETEESAALWAELKDIALFWTARGIRIFRVDNPHTKPFPFWEWLIREVKNEFPTVIFLAEAFTRPKVMYRLAQLGFTQSYTYFTWRNTKREITEYLEELTQSAVREFFRPNFWPNTPDILAEYLQEGGRPAFLIRLVLAATLSSNYGIYGPAFELCVREALPGGEEYRNSEKYEVKYWDRNQPGNLRDFISRLNRIRRENPALQTTRNLRFYEVENENLLFYAKEAEDLEDMLLVLVNLDPFHTQSGWARIFPRDLGIDPDQPYLLYDLLSEDKYIWQGERNFVELNPRVLPANIFRVRKRRKRETDFDYFM